MMTQMAMGYRQTSLTACVVWAIVTAACGRQTDTGYLGEPLLSIRGQVTSSALSDAPQAVPALCLQFFTGDISSSSDGLPSELREVYSDEDVGGSPYDLNIVDVESRGNFPAEFAIDVYVPPDPSMLAPLVTGEPPSAFGSVCAVTSDHAQRVRGLRGVGIETCAEGSGCSGLALRMNNDASRYYFERHSCPEAARSVDDCEITPEGDATLKLESGGYESVLELNWDIQVIYLAEPAAPGSYTAYKAGAPDGLPAGYHVRSKPNWMKPGIPEACFEGWVEAAFAEFNHEHNTAYAHEHGLWAYGSEEQIASFRDISARREMEACPIEYVTTQSAETDQLSIELVPGKRWPLPTLRPGQPPGQP